MKRSLLCVSALVLLAMAAGCGGPRVMGGMGLEERMRTELYFGRSMPGGGGVSEEAWAAFVAEEITPRFSDGLTVEDAHGQYLNNEGELVHERTKVVTLIHRDTPQARIDLLNIIFAYKRRFEQESVLRVTQGVWVSF